MTRRRLWGWYSSGPKQAPPEHGIKVKRSGATWWGQRWIEALESVLRGDSARLARGRTYARAGRTHDLVVHGAKVTARVTGSRATPYEITIELGRVPDTTWEQAIVAMAAKAEFTAELLAGEMPREIDEAFRAAGASLFPRQRAELITTCSCPDWGDPCKHVAATHYVLGEALDRDPFLLFELRGRTKAQVLDLLRHARGGAPAPAPTSSRKRSKGEVTPTDAAASEVPSVKLGKLAAADYDRPREALPTLHFSFEAPATHGAILRQLGTPAGWDATLSPEEALSPLVRRAAEAARRIAMMEAETAAAEDRAPAPTEDAAAEAPGESTRARTSAARRTKSPARALRPKVSAANAPAAKSPDARAADADARATAKARNMRAPAVSAGSPKARRADKSTASTPTANAPTAKARRPAAPTATATPPKAPSAKRSRRR